MSRVGRNTSHVHAYFQRARQHYQQLGVKDDGEFTAFFGCGKTIKNKWYSTGILPIYNKILGLLEEVRQLREDRDRLEKELEEILKK